MPDIHINQPDVVEAVRKMHNCRQVERDAAKRAKDWKVIVDAALDGLIAEHGHPAVFVLGDIRVHVGHADGTPRINGKKLLAAGVDPDIIAAATERSPYRTLRTQLIPADGAGA